MLVLKTILEAQYLMLSSVAQLAKLNPLKSWAHFHQIHTICNVMLMHHHINITAWSQELQVGNDERNDQQIEPHAYNKLTNKSGPVPAQNKDLLLLASFWLFDQSRLRSRALSTSTNVCCLVPSLYRLSKRAVWRICKLKSLQPIYIQTLLLLSWSQMAYLIGVGWSFQNCRECSVMCLCPLWTQLVYLGSTYYLTIQSCVWPDLCALTNVVLCTGTIDNDNISVRMIAINTCSKQLLVMAYGLCVCGCL
jgi:hypothetical protein